MKIMPGAAIYTRLFKPGILMFGYEGFFGQTLIEWR
jgi:hypothetical protein